MCLCCFVLPTPGDPGDPPPITSPPTFQKPLASTQQAAIRIAPWVLSCPRPQGSPTARRATPAPTPQSSTMTGPPTTVRWRTPRWCRRTARRRPALPGQSGPRACVAGEGHRPNSPQGTPCSGAQGSHPTVQTPPNAFNYYYY